MKKILFITENERKIWQAQSTLEPFGIVVEAQKLDIQEIQALDPLDIADAKARTAYEHFKKPLVVCDHAWSIPALKGFPGGYMKDVNKWLVEDDWLALLADKKDRSIILTETVVFIDGDTTKHFSVEFPAHFIHEAHGSTNGHPCERIVAFDGFTETITQRIDAGQHARDMSKSAWQEFGRWY
ncbi:MAG TPA: non-canonical purine NTP pyrophosphatase [Verrucomicrobiae bacterium]|nr:non-canonical purine NTP pyrophosphatase [Verrucomicrobiae bacterium]